MKIPSSIFSLLLAATAAHAAPPVLQNISFSEETFDISSGNSATTQVTFDVVSPDNIESISIQILDSEPKNAGTFTYTEGASGDLQRTAGDATGGSYTGELVIPPFRPGGQWNIILTLEEVNGDQTSYFVDDDPFPSDFGGSFDVTNSGTIDTGPPVVSLLTISPTSVDVATTEQTVTFSTNVSDDTGIASLFIDIYDNTDDLISSTPIIGNRTSGDATSGTYEFTTTIPAMISPTTWVPDIRATDLSNRTIVFGFSVGAQSFPEGSDLELQITNTSTVDNEPTLVSFTATPESVDITSGARTIDIRAEGSDVGGKIQFIDVIVGDEPIGLFAELDRIAPNSNTFEGVLTIPAFFPPGNYGLEVAVSDDSNNEVIYSSSDEPFPAGSTSSIAVANSGAADSGAPTFGTVTLSPDPFPRDISLPATLTITFSATDDLSGVSKSYAELTHNINSNFFQEVEFDAGQRTSGDALSGTYTTEITVNSIPPEGFFKVFIELFDATQFSTEFETNLAISDSSPLTYSAWLAANPSLPEGETSPTSDPDGDTLPNAIEFALGFDPTTSDPVPPVELTATTIGLTIPADLPSTTAILTTQSSSDLISWATIPGTTALRDSEATTFLRLAVTLDEE